MKSLIKLIIMITMILILIGIFLSPIYWMIIESWLAGFLFLISWIPTVAVAKVFLFIVEDW